jgi:hypothetical protein
MSLRGRIAKEKRMKKSVSTAIKEETHRHQWMSQRG